MCACVSRKKIKVWFTKLLPNVMLQFRTANLSSEMLPYVEDLLWLHVVITCPPPPYVPEMHTSVNSTHPDKRHRVVGNDIRTFNSAQNSSDESVSLIEN